MSRIDSDIRVYTKIREFRGKWKNATFQEQQRPFFQMLTTVNISNTHLLEPMWAGLHPTMKNIQPENISTVIVEQIFVCACRIITTWCKYVISADFKSSQKLLYRHTQKIVIDDDFAFFVCYTNSNICFPQSEWFISPNIIIFSIHFAQYPLKYR